ncbi:MAG: protease inhibitor I42 family protein [Dehalococcoidales bacterium]|nr:protease inhibitor I42 family protein [Dehalococcoidales bacterium]
MKKFLILVAVAAIFLITGCAGGVKTYTDPEQTLSVSVNQEFIVALSSNPTTGYTWQENYDEAMLKLVEKTYEQSKEAKPPVVGAGGTEFFRFQALKAGETKITMVYMRTWEAQSADHKVFTVKIK